MTSKQVYEATAIELSKVQAPALKLYEFNYFFNQAIRQFVNKVYNVYDVNQQTTDDLRVLKATATLVPTQATVTNNAAIDYLQRGTYFVDMPDDYLHLLNCICLFDVKQNKDCWNEGDVMVVGATKLTADSWSSVVDDVYNRPTKKRPYYYIHNQNKINKDSDGDLIKNNVLPSNNTTDKLHESETISLWNQAYDIINKSDVIDTSVIASLTDLSTTNTFIQKLVSFVAKYIANGGTDKQEVLVWMTNHDSSTLKGSNFKRTFGYDDTQQDAIDKPAGSRHANASTVRVEIRCGRDKSNIFDLAAVQIDYVKAPQFIRLTQEELDSDEDISQVMEFPDYVNQEIINELVNLVMRKTNDPSLQTHIQMTQSIARPTGQQQQ